MRRVNRPSLGDVSRAGGACLFVGLIEVASLLPNASVKVGLSVWQFPLLAWFDAAFGAAVPDKLKFELSARLSEYSVYLVLALACIPFSRRIIRQPIVLGVLSTKAFFWISGIVASSWLLTKASLWYAFPEEITSSWILDPFCGGMIVRSASISSAWLFLLAFALPTLVAPVSEEIVYRGFLYNALVPMIGFASAAVISSLVFSLAHYRVVITPIDYVRHFIVGLLLFASRRRFAGIGVPVVAHVLLNSLYAFDSLLRCEMS